jgi:hypothetical protein
MAVDAHSRVDHNRGVAWVFDQSVLRNALTLKLDSDAESAEDLSHFNKEPT